MRTFLKTVGIWFGLLIASETLFASENVGTFSGLQKGEELRVDFDSRGCFHCYTYELKFSRTAAGVVVSFTSETRGALGELVLGMSDLAGLDRLLSFYRSVRLGGCTTKDSIKVARLRKGTIVATERFTDESCEASSLSYDNGDMLTIHAMILRLRKSQ